MLECFKLGFVLSVSLSEHQVKQIVELPSWVLVVQAFNPNIWEGEAGKKDL